MLRKKDVASGRLGLGEVKAVRLSGTAPSVQEIAVPITVRVMPVTQNLPLRWLPSRPRAVVGSVLGLVGPASVYFDLLRRQRFCSTS